MVYVEEARLTHPLELLPLIQRFKKYFMDELESYGINRSNCHYSGNSDDPTKKPKKIFNQTM